MIERPLSEVEKLEQEKILKRLRDAYQQFDRANEELKTARQELALANEKLWAATGSSQMENRADGEQGDKT